jgi:thioredoxin 1
MIKNITNVKEFNDVIQTSKEKVIVDFYADWCGPCKMQAPVLDDFSKKQPESIILKVNVDHNMGVSAQFGVRSIPTILFIKNGEVVDKSVGAVPKAVLAEKLEALM